MGGILHAQEFVNSGSAIGIISDRVCAVNNARQQVQSLPMEWDAHTLQVLELDYVRQEWAKRADTPFGREHVLARDLSRDETLVAESPFRLKMISSRGTKVYPPTGTITDVVDHYRCRFLLRDASGEATDAQILDLVQRVGSRFRWMHLEKLQEFDGAMGYTKAQGED